MSYGSATVHSPMELPSVGLARSIATVIPMILLSYPALVWQLLYSKPVVTATSAFAAPDAEAGSFLLTKIFIPGLFAIALAAFLIVRPSLSRREKSLLVWLGLFFAYCAVSSLWSLDPAYTLRKTVYQTLLCGTIAMAVFTSRDPRRILALVFALFIVTVLANLAAVLTRPPGPIGYEGIYSHKNSLGSAVALIFLFALYFVISTKGGMRLVAMATAAACVFLLIKSESKTAMGLAALAPLAGVLLYVLARWLRVSPLVAILFGLSATVAAYFLISRLFGFDSSDLLLFVFNDATFTGRTDIWSFVWDHIQQRPLLGYGYQGFWGIPASPKLDAEPAFIAGMAHGHNGFLDAVLNVGIIGAALLIIPIVKIIRSCGRIDGREARLSWLYLTTIFFLVCTNLMETVLLLSEEVDEMVFFLVAFLAVASSTAPRCGTELDSRFRRPRSRSGAAAMTTRVSICIPTFKRPLGLRKLLLELPGLTGDFEINVVVADNDADGSEGLAAARELAASGYPLPLTAIVVSERGIAQVRNALVETALASRPEFICMLDDNSWPAPDWLEILHAILETTSADMANGIIAHHYESEPSPEIAALYTAMRKRSWSEGPGPDSSNTCGLVARRSVFESMTRPWFQPDYGLAGGEDDDFFLRASSEGLTFAFSPSAVVTENIPASRATSRFLGRRAFAQGASCDSRSIPAATGRLVLSRGDREEFLPASLSVSATFAVGFWSPRGRLKAEFRIMRAAGKVNGLFGNLVEVYRVTHGN